MAYNRRDAAFSMHNFWKWYSRQEIKTGPGSDKLIDERGWGFSLLGDQAAIPYLFCTKRGRFEKKRLFQILLTGSRALNIYPIKSKNNHIQYTEHGLYNLFQIWSSVKFQCQYSILDFRAWIVTDHFCHVILHFSFVCYPRWQFLTWQGENKRKGERRLFQIFPSQGGDYSREAINGGSNSRKSLIQIKS